MSSCPFGFSSENKSKKNKNLLKESKLYLYLKKDYEKSLLPKKSEVYLDWWEKDPKTKGMAKFCMPLLMANGLGYNILSPATIEIEWDGNENHSAKINIIDKCTHALVTNHSACGSFTIQTGFVPKTEEGYYTYVKGIPNIRRPFSVMEALIESWWNPAHFGIVCLCNYAGKFIIRQGEPLAQMVLLHQDAIKVKLEVKENEFEIFQRKEFLEKRLKSVFNRDYFKGLYPDGKEVEHHIKPSVYREE